MTDHDKLREAIAYVRAAQLNLVMMGDEGVANFHRVLKAAESTLPKTKMVEVWRVEYSTPGMGREEWLCLNKTYRREEDARTGALPGNGLPSFAMCIRVTGPHQQEVPV